MKYFITMMLVCAFLAGCGDKEEEACDACPAEAADAKKLADASGVSEDCQSLCAKKGVDGDECKSYCDAARKQALCYWGCLEADKSSAECKKGCYGDKKAGKDVVDSPDAVSPTDDVSGTDG